MVVALLATGRASVAWEQVGPYRYSGVDRLVAVGDIHGALDEFRTLLLKLDLIDGQDQWRGGRAHLVSVGDLLDRGDDSRAVMDLLRSLQVQADDAGGRVHILLGNHEVMNLSGELDYVTDGEFASYLDLVPVDARPPEDLPPGYLGHQVAFAPDGAYGAWLLSLPFAIVVNDHLFLHGGISSKLEGLDLPGVNRQAHQQLDRFIHSRHRLIAQGELRPGLSFSAARRAARALSANPEAPEAARSAANEYLDAGNGLPFAASGPVWYRRTAVCHPYAESPVSRAVLEDLGASRVVIGHTPTLGRTIQSRMNGTVVLIDTGMNVAYYKGKPAAWQWSRGQESVVYADQSLSQVVVQEHRHWARPYGMDDRQIEQFMAEAEVVKIEELATGVTKPKRLTLQLGERNMRAAYKDFDSSPGLETASWKRSSNKADRYHHDVAAYKLDRLLGLGMVPPSIIRSVEGRPGVVTYWIEGAINERDRRDDDVDYVGECTPRSQYNLMNVFDILIHNDDRNLTNVLYTRKDWQLWLIDHSRGFRSFGKRPDYLQDAEIVLTPPLRTALEQVDEAFLKPLSPYLHEKQIRGIVDRARGLLDESPP